MRRPARPQSRLKYFSSPITYSYVVMTMAFFREDPTASFEYTDYESVHQTPSASRPVPDSVPMIREKLHVPVSDSAFPREWLGKLLDRSVRNATATMIIGRAGTGKTELAAQYVSKVKGAVWYTVDSVDGEWNTFQTYFRAAVLNGETGARSSNRRKLQVPGCVSPLDLLADVTAGLELIGKDWPPILVLDGIHHLFDCSWFDDFFDLLIASMPVGSHVIMLSRSKPPTPIWRLRSKQVLNVIDEKLLALSQSEAEQLLAHYNAKVEDLESALSDSFGRIGGLMEMLGPKIPRVA